MHIGIQTAQIGRFAGPDTIRSTAVAAEQIGYSSIWVHDRLDLAIGSGSARPRRALDPFVVLAAIAAVTSRVRLGTSVLAAPRYPAGVLARSLTSLDVISGGRLTVGLGLGPERSTGGATGGPTGGSTGGAMGAPHRSPGAGLDAVLDLLDSAWSGTGAPAHGLPQPADELHPVQRPHPPVLLAGSTGAAVERVARRADGWNPVGHPIDELADTWARIRDRAASHGRDPDALRLVVRADIRLEPRPLERDRPVYCGSLEQVVDDLVATREAGADEVILGLIGDPGLDEMLDGYARLADGVGMP